MHCSKNQTIADNITVWLSMDKTDIILTKLLLVNSRLSYRELADKLGLSVNAVHKRIRALTNSGVIRIFTAKASLLALKAHRVLVFGKSEAKTVDRTCDRLGKNDSTYWVAVAGGNYLYIGAYLQNIAELESYVAFVKKIAQLSTPTVGIVQEESIRSTHDITLYPLDYQIIYALRHNSRKAISDIAEELGVTAKTIRRRLSRMIDEGLIELSLEWYPGASNEIITIFHLYLQTHTDERKASLLLLNNYSPNVLFVNFFRNLPKFLLCVTWTSTMKDLRDLRKSFECEELFESIVPNILYTGYIYDTWRDELVLEKGKRPPKNN
ncbi:MAG: winged helix-turn-helix transcriptional regulator [Candidatus Heimdallarchaeota archaeon]